MPEVQRVEKFFPILGRVYPEDIPEGLTQEEFKNKYMILPEKYITAPRDPRFPNTNQAKHCWVKYNEWLLCGKKNDNDLEHKNCMSHHLAMKVMCPSAWTEKWEEDREEGRFAGVKGI